MLGIGKQVKVWAETTNGGLMLVGSGVVEVMGMGKLVVRDITNQVQDFVLQHVVVEEDNEGWNELRSGTCPKPAGAKGVRVYHKQKAHFHRGGSYRTERYLTTA